ncbi:MAG: TIGR02677 family protein [Euzebya sp.]
MPEPPDLPAQDQESPVSTAEWSGFHHLSATKADRYRRILTAFADERRNYVVHLRPQDVARALGEAPGDTLKAELDQLAEWRNLRPSPDTTRVTSVEEFAQRRMLYSLTRMGEAVEASLGTYTAMLARRAELQTVALEDIRTGLAALILLAQAETVDASRSAAALRDLDTVFSGLADNAAAFMSSLTRSIDTAAEGEEGFIAYKEGLIGYLQRFISDLVVASGQIGDQMATLERLGIDRVLRAAASRRSADAAPADAAPADANADTAFVDTPDYVAEHLFGLQREWEGLRRWFVGSPDGPSQAELLRARARAAIPDLLETVQTLHERRAGRSDRMADYLTLARWFAEAPDGRARHRLWRAAFGLHPSRHLGIDSETLDARAEDDVPATTPWAQAPAVHVSARLRRTTRYSRPGASHIVDRSDSRRALARQLDAERDELSVARSALATGELTRLSDLCLDADTFPFLLALLGDALSSGRSDQRIDTTSSDGTLHITLEPTHDGALAHITTPLGTLTGHDHYLQVTDLLSASSHHIAAPVPHE